MPSPEPRWRRDAPRVASATDLDLRAADHDVVGVEADICPRCGGKMKLRSLVQKPENIARFLRHLGEPTEPPPLAVPSGPRACPPCPCPTRAYARARRLPAGHRSGRAAFCAAATGDRTTRVRRRRPRHRRGHPVRRSSADRATFALRREISPEGPGFSEFGPVRPPPGHLRVLGHEAATPVNRPPGLLYRLQPMILL